MGQLFDRLSRLARAELNSNKSDYEENYSKEGADLVVRGAFTGASVGKVGILAGGAGYSLGAVPLAAAGALTGAALYETLRSLIESDASSVNAAAIGAVAGASTSVAIGGVGVAAGGSAIGVGMASMAAGGAVVGLGIVGLNRLFQQDIDPEKLLNKAIEQMEADAQNARQAVVNIATTQKRLQQQYEQTEAEVAKWKRRAQLALKKGDEHLAREALIRKRMQSKTLSSLEIQINQEPVSLKNLEQNLTLLKVKISEAKTLRISLKAQIAAARANGQLQSAEGRTCSNTAMSAFKRLEEKVLQMEAKSQAAAELAGVDLESQFAMLESGSNVDDELAAMKAQLLSRAAPNQALLLSNPTAAAPKDAAVDAELEALKTQLDQL